MLQQRKNPFTTVAPQTDSTFLITHDTLFIAHNTFFITRAGRIMPIYTFSRPEPPDIFSTFLLICTLCHQPTKEPPYVKTLQITARVFLLPPAFILKDLVQYRHAFCEWRRRALPQVVGRNMDFSAKTKTFRVVYEP